MIQFKLTTKQKYKDETFRKGSLSDPMPYSEWQKLRLKYHEGCRSLYECNNLRHFYPISMRKIVRYIPVDEVDIVRWDERDEFRKLHNIPLEDKLDEQIHTPRKHIRTTKRNRSK